MASQTRGSFYSMLNFDSEARTDPRLLLIQRAERGKERARQFQRRRRFATVAAVALFLMAFGIARAWAWTASVQPSTDCNGTTFVGTVGNEPGSHTAAVTFGGETKSVTVPAEGGNSFTLHFNSHDGGPWSYKGTWSETSEVERQRGELSAVTDCEQEETPTPTTNPTPTTAPEVPDEDHPEVGTPTNQHRAAPPDQHRAAPPDQHGPPVTAPPVEQPGTLPFTGPRDWLLPIGLGLFVAGAAMVLAGRRRFQQMTLAAKAADRAMHGKPYDGPHERL